MSSGSDFPVWNVARVISAEKLALSSFFHVSFSYCLILCNNFSPTYLSVSFSLSSLLLFYFCLLLSCISFFLFFAPHLTTLLFCFWFSPSRHLKCFGLFSSLRLNVFLSSLFLLSSLFICFSLPAYLVLILFYFFSSICCFCTTLYFCLVSFSFLLFFL